MRKLIVAAAAAALLAGGANAAVANPYNGEGPGPGNSGENSVFGLCTAYGNVPQQAKDNSPVFADDAPWIELCDEADHPSSNGQRGGRP